MKKLMMSFVAFSSMALLGSGCVSLDEFTRVQKHLENEQQANVALAAENTRQEGEINRLRSDRDGLVKAIEDLKDAHARTPQISEGDIVRRIQDIWGRDMSGWETVQSGGAFGVRMDDSGVLFRSGSWELTDNTKAKLSELASIVDKQLKSNPNMFVRVDGHTDTDPVQKLKSKGIADNIHLSVMRGMAVRDFLVSKGIAKDRIFVAGFGEYWPLNKGSSAKDKQRNRRVEVYLGDADALSIGALPGAQVQK